MCNIKHRDKNYYNGGNIMSINLESLLKIVDFIMGIFRGLMNEGLLDDFLG